MVREPLQLEADPANALASRALVTARQRLDRAAIRAGVGDHHIAGDRFGDQHTARSIARLEQPLDSAVLIAEHDFEQQHILAMRLKAEMSGLDDAGMHRPDGDLVHLAAFEPRKRILLAAKRCGRNAPTRGSVVGRVAPKRLE